MKKLIWIYILILLSFLMSCSKVAFDDNGLQEKEAFATIMDAGVGAADGCGWMLLIGDEYYHPQNLAPEFQISGLEVYVNYSITKETFYCGIAVLPYQTISIIDIHKQSRSCQTVHSYNSSTYFYHKDAFKINSVKIISDCLQVSLSYSGGCKAHEFMLFEDISKAELTFQLSHNANNDPCEAWITTSFSYELSPFQNKDSTTIGFFLQSQGYRQYFEYYY